MGTGHRLTVNIYICTIIELNLCKIQASSYNRTVSWSKKTKRIGIEWGTSASDLC
jgi:hypothetical protein